MDYTDILKRAWNVTWRYKILWLFGLFAGAGGGFSSNGTGYRGGSSSGQPFNSAQWDAFGRSLQAHLGLILLGVVVLFVIGFVWFVISIAARGGLIHLVNEAEEGRPVAAGAGWSVGFGKWWRIFGVEFVAGLPLLIVAVIAGTAVAAAVIAAVRQGGSLDSLPGSFAGALIGGVCFLLVLGVVGIVFAVILGIVAQIALRYVVIEDRHVMESLKAGWHDLWSRRGAFVMFLITIGLGIAFGIVLAIIAVLLVAPGVGLILVHAYLPGGLLVALAVLVLLLPGAIYGTFYSAVWTAFFRQMTGRQPAPAAVAPAGGGYPAAPAYAPAPPTAPYPPAPPAPPAYQPPPPAYVPAPPATPPAPPLEPPHA